MTKRRGAAIENHFGGDQPERTLNLDAVRMDMFLLNGTVRTEVALDTGVLIIWQVPLLYLSACNHFSCL